MKGASGSPGMLGQGQPAAPGTVDTVIFTHWCPMVTGKLRTDGFFEDVVFRGRNRNRSQKTTEVKESPGKVSRTQRLEGGRRSHPMHFLKCRHVPSDQGRNKKAGDIQGGGENRPRLGPLSKGCPVPPAIAGGSHLDLGHGEGRRKTCPQWRCLGADVWVPPTFLWSC